MYVWGGMSENDVKKVWKNFKIKITFTNFTGIVSDFKKRS